MIFKYILFSFCVLACGAKDETNKKDAANRVNINTISNDTNMSDTSFLKFWSHFLEIARKGNRPEFSNSSLDTLECEGRPVSLSLFFREHFSVIFDDTFFDQISDSSQYHIFDKGLSSSSIIENVRKKIDDSQSVTAKSVNVNKRYDLQGPEIVSLDFLLTKGGWKFYGYTSTRKKL